MEALGTVDIVTAVDFGPSSMRAQFRKKDSSESYPARQWLFPSSIHDRESNNITDAETKYTTCILLTTKRAHLRSGIESAKWIFPGIKTALGPDLADGREDTE